MTDKKISALTALSGALAAVDLFEMVDDPSGTPTSKSVTAQQVANFVVGGTTSKTTPTGADLVPIGDAAASNVAKYVTAAALLGVTNGLTTFSDPQTGDKFLAWDTSAGAAKGITFETFLAVVDVLTTFSGTIDGAADKLVFWDDGAGTIHSITPDKLAAGLWTLAVPAAALSPRSANGCAALAVTSGASGQPDVPYLAFDGAAAEYARFGPFRFPKGWNAGTITASVTWRRASGTGAADVIWGIRALSIGDNESPAQNFGSGATVTDAASTTTANFMTSAPTGACTIAGSPAKGDMIFIEVYRDAAAGGDTLNSVDAWLSELQIYYSTDARDDA